VTPPRDLKLWIMRGLGALAIVGVAVLGWILVSSAAYVWRALQ
jgi:hypothetical protein